MNTKKESNNSIYRAWQRWTKTLPALQSSENIVFDRENDMVHWDILESNKIFFQHALWGTPGIKASYHTAIIETYATVLMQLHERDPVLADRFSSILPPPLEFQSDICALVDAPYRAAHYQQFEPWLKNISREQLSEHVHHITPILEYMNVSVQEHLWKCFKGMSHLNWLTIENLLPQHPTPQYQTIIQEHLPAILGRFKKHLHDLVAPMLQHKSGSIPEWAQEIILTHIPPSDIITYLCQRPNVASTKDYKKLPTTDSANNSLWKMYNSSVETMFHRQKNNRKATYHLFQDLPIWHNMPHLLDEWIDYFQHEDEAHITPTLAVCMLEQGKADTLEKILKSNVAIKKGIITVWIDQVTQYPDHPQMPILRDMIVRTNDDTNHFFLLDSIMQQIQDHKRNILDSSRFYQPGRFVTPTEARAWCNQGITSLYEMDALTLLRRDVPNPTPETLAALLQADATWRELYNDPVRPLSPLRWKMYIQQHYQPMPKELDIPGEAFVC